MATDIEFGSTRGGIRGQFDYFIEEYTSAQGILFLLPSLILLSGIIFFPMITFGIPLGFQNYTLNPNTPNPFVGLDNYKYWIFGGGAGLLLYMIKITLLYELIVISLDVIVGLGAALILNEKMPARPLWRGLLLAGYASPPVAAGLTFRIMSDQAEYGVLYQLVEFFVTVPTSGGLTASTPWAFWMVVLAKVWRDFGFMLIILLAGLQSIPSELYEIAKVDGAGPIDRFRHITLPHIRTVLLTAIIIRSVFTIGRIEVPWAVTKGGPVRDTTFVAIRVYQVGFRSFNLGRAAALGLMLAAVIVPLILLWINLETEDL